MPGSDALIDSTAVLALHFTAIAGPPARAAPRPSSAVHRYRECGDRRARRNIATDAVNEAWNCVETVYGGLETGDEYLRSRTHIEPHFKAASC